MAGQRERSLRGDGLAARKPDRSRSTARFWTHSRSNQGFRSIRPSGPMLGTKADMKQVSASNIWLLQRNDGRWFVLASVINDPNAEIDGGRLFSLMIPAADLLAATE